MKANFQLLTAVSKCVFWVFVCVSVQLILLAQVR